MCLSLKGPQKQYHQATKEIILSNDLKKKKIFLKFNNTVWGKQMEGGKGEVFSIVSVSVSSL